MDINDAGSVVGWSETANGAVHPFLWTAADGIQDLGVIPGPPRGSFTPHSSQAWSINDQGVIAGTSSNSADGRLCPCWGWIRYPDGRTEDFGTISGSYPAQGVKLNNADEAAGTGYLAGGGGAFVWRWTLLGGLEAVTTPTWQIQDYATGFNDHGEIVGTVEGSSDAVLWDANNVRTDLVGMDDPLAINNLSQVVGTGQTVGYVLWAEGVLTDITSLGVSPWDINDSGQMAGPYKYWDGEQLIGGIGWARALNNAGQIVGASGCCVGHSNGQATLWTVVYRLATPREELRILYLAVYDLVRDGILDDNLAKPLQVKLDAAGRQLDRDNPEGVAGPLGAFINLVEAWKDDPPGILPPERGQDLIDAAQNAIAQLSG